MNRYLFTTATTLHDPRDFDKWWIDRDVVGRAYMYADSVADAMTAYREHADRCGVSISDNALAHKDPMYIDGADGEPVQTGYVVIGKTLFNDDYRRWVEKYVELWITIEQINSPDFAD